MWKKVFDNYASTGLAARNLERATMSAHAPIRHIHSTAHEKDDRTFRRRENCSFLLGFTEASPIILVRRVDSLVIKSASPPDLVITLT